MVNMIYSISYKDNIIGDRNTNDLVFNIKEDLQFFKKMTTGSTLIMGRNTFISLPTGGLPKRKHVIVTNKIKNDVEAKEMLGKKYIENLTFISTEELPRYLENESKNNKIFVVGGGMLYDYFIQKKELLSMISNIYVTEVERIPNIKNPVKLNCYLDIKNLFKSEVLEESQGKDRLFHQEIVSYKVIRYHK